MKGRTKTETRVSQGEAVCEKKASCHGKSNLTKAWPVGGRRVRGTWIGSLANISADGGKKKRWGEQEDGKKGTGAALAGT